MAESELAGASVAVFLAAGGVCYTSGDMMLALYMPRLSGLSVVPPLVFVENARDSDQGAISVSVFCIEIVMIPSHLILLVQEPGMTVCKYYASCNSVAMYDDVVLIVSNYNDRVNNNGRNVRKLDRFFEDC